MITFSVAMMATIISIMSMKQANATTKIDIPGGLFIVTGLLDVWCAYIIWGGQP
jgi:hypothetical protein